QKTAFVNDKGGGSVGLRQQFAQDLFQSLDVFFNELRECRHGFTGPLLPSAQAYCGVPWLTNLCSNMRVIMLSVSKTPSHRWALDVNDGTWTSRLFSRNSMYSTGATFGKSRLLY